MQGQPGFMSSNQSAPLVNARSQMLYRTVRGLAITQIFIGSVSVLLGVLAVVMDVRYENQYQGVWGGIWICLTGVIGITSSKNPNSCCITGIYMSFSIVSTLLAFFSGILFINGILHFSDCYVLNDDTCNEEEVQAGLGVMIPFLVAMITEFFVAIIGTAYACKSTDCCTSCIEQNAVVISTQQQYQISPSTLHTQSGGLPIPASYSPPSYPSTEYHLPPEYPGYTHRPASMPAPGQVYSNPVLLRHNGRPAIAETNTVYTAQPTAPIPDMAPPPYDSLRCCTK